MIARFLVGAVGTAAGAMSRPSQYVGVVLLIVVLLATILAPLSGYQPGFDADLLSRDLPPSAEHLLGTDHSGRDVFWRLALACRSFVGPGIVACLVAAVLGVPAGAAAGYYGGGLSAVLRYGFTVIASLPRFVLVLLVCTVYGTDMFLLALAVGVAYTPTLGEAVHARVESLRNAEYVLANRAYGLPTWRILWVHLVLAACGKLIGRHLLAVFGYFLVLETTLSYLGSFGIQEPQPSWGNMLAFEWGRQSAWGLGVLAPAAAIWLTIGATVWVGTLLREEAR